MMRLLCLHAVLAALLLASIPATGWADSSVPVTYSRTSLVINRAHPPAPAVSTTESLPWQAPAAPDPRLPLAIEMRDGRTLYSQSGWYNLSSMSANNGIMLVFNTPDTPPITRATQYAPLDILFIDKHGKITQIAPSIVLSELDDDIYPTSPISAFLFMQGGSCAAYGIAPGDTVEHEFFKKPPVILSAPAAAAPVVPGAPGAPAATAASVRPVEQKILRPLEGPAPKFPPKKPTSEKTLKAPTTAPERVSPNAPLQNPFFNESKP
jgi:uncharacterized membrane protein (UPF0127 family)